MQKRLSGNGGYVWVNGKLLTTLQSVEAKVTGDFEEVKYCGDLSTHHEYQGWSGEGTLKFGKTDSTVWRLVANGYKTGNMPDITVNTKLMDLSTGKAERATIKQVQITEFFLAQFEAKTPVDEEVPINFSDYKIDEMI